MSYCKDPITYRPNGAVNRRFQDNGRGWPRTQLLAQIAFQMFDWQQFLSPDRALYVRLIQSLRW